MPEQLFDLTEEYQGMLDAGISLSGETQEFFIAGRTQDLRNQLRQTPKRILDFGCGIGKSCAYLAKLFPKAQITGVDLSSVAILHANKTYSSSRIGFAHIDDMRRMKPFDLCYVNGVFHHIAPADRQYTLETIRRALLPGGQLAIFENNPWNPGARMVMRRIPFDRDAIPLSVLELRKRMRHAGYEVVSSRFLFYLPKPLSALRFIEPYLVKVPLGAQYYVLGRVPTDPSRTGSPIKE